jgi:transposase
LNPHRYSSEFTGLWSNQSSSKNPWRTGIEALASGSTVTEAAERAGVARETVSRWVQRDPEFIAELQNRRAEMAR